MNKLKSLHSYLLSAGFKKEAILTSLLIKVADSRRNIVQRLGLTKEEADYFHNLSPQKSYDLARWFVEWRKENNNSYASLYASLEDEINDFDKTYSIMGDEDYFYNPEQYILFDIIIKDDSFYQSVKNKSLNQIFYSDGNKASPFELYVLKQGYRGFEFSPGKNYSWYDVGQECEIVSAFLHNCGSIGGLSNEGDYDGEGDFTMMALKDADKKPVMVITVGKAYSPSFGDDVNVIVNASVKSNYFPTNQDLLEHLFDLARKEEYHFALLYDASTGQQIIQSPGLKSDIITGAGFEIIVAQLGVDRSYDDKTSEEFEEE
jgi:hypothetical protein